MNWGRKLLFSAAAAALSLPMMMNQAMAEKTLRVVMHSDLKIVDPIWTTAYMSRNYGYMVYDTLFASDAQGNSHPQMAEGYTVSDDKKTYSITLRDGLEWHDGKPVTAADAAASLKRWGKKDAMGGKLMEFVDDIVAVNDKTLEIRLKEPFGLTIDALAKPSSNVPFIMPERIANTPADEQISEYVGSGPFIFDAENWKPGDRAIFLKNTKYKPRSEAPSWASGGKVVHVDRVEWISIKDHQTAVNALIEGEIDYIESTPKDLVPLLEGEDSVQLKALNDLGFQNMFRLNHLHPPFNNVKARRAALAAINQRDFLQAVHGDPKYYKECPAMFICDTKFATDKGADIIMKSDVELGKKLLAESGYDGTPIVIMHPTDLDVLANLAPVAADALKKVGFKVDLQAMDWQTLVSRRSKKDAPGDVGWNIFLTAWGAPDVMNPITTQGLRANCGDAWFGWPCDEKMEQLRDQFVRETDEAKQVALAHAIQEHAMAIGTHAHAGQYFNLASWRKDRLDGVLGGPIPLFWNITKK